MNSTSNGIHRSLGRKYLLKRRLGFCTGVIGSLLLGGAVSCYASDAARIDALEAKVEQLTQEQANQGSALEEALSHVEITGYISLRGGKLNERGITYLGGVSDELSFSNETTFGVQLKAPVTEDIHMVLQLSGDSIETQAEVDWAFMEYQMSSSLNIRAGRLRVPGFMVSEYQAVGYAYPWVQTPLEVYGLTPFLRYEGVDFRYFTSIGDVDVRINPFIGSTSNQGLRIGQLIYANQDSQFGGIDIQVNYESVNVRVGYSKYEFDLKADSWDVSMEALIEGLVVIPGDPAIESSGIVDVIDQLAAGATATAATIAGLGDLVTAAFYTAEAESFTAQRSNYLNDSIMGGEQEGEYFSVGFSYDSENIVLMAEMIKGGISGAFPNAKGSYATLGYRLGSWMPHLTYATLKSTDDSERPALPEFEATDALWVAIPDVAAGITGVNTMIGLVNDTRNLSNPNQYSWTLGVRWDPLESVAVKMEYQYISLPGQSYGYVLPSAVVRGEGGASGFDEKVDNVNVVKLSLDLVF
ncbi:hypothetical protein A9Q81_03185 [Gammaproteobacteria bacterium 42_54_T18]|nr:hypothetical protein A9Q81_03185 [Gammaproteobacteria bacterium 42_54_T18]